MIIIMISRVLQISCLILTRAETSLACFTPPPLKWWPSLLPLLSATVPSEVRIIDSSPLLPRSHIPSMTCLTVVQTVSPPHLYSPWTHSHLFWQFPFIYVVIRTECLLLWGSVSLRMSINVQEQKFDYFSFTCHAPEALIHHDDQSPSVIISCVQRVRTAVC